LLGLSADDIRQALEIPNPLAERLAGLMARGGQLSIELERLQALGIWVITRADEGYPTHLRERLKAQAPPVLFGAGPAALLHKKGVAIVGSRDVDDAGAAFAATLGQRCAASGLIVFSGGARGADGHGVDGALEAGGSAVAVIPDSLEDAIKRREPRERVLSGRLTLVTPAHPSAKFTIAAAMARNKLIYALASWAVVVALDAESGGTWSGAIENLRANWVPLFVRDGADVPTGNKALVKRGGRPLVVDELPARASRRGSNSALRRLSPRPGWTLRMPIAGPTSQSGEAVVTVRVVERRRTAMGIAQVLSARRCS
jgi:predicted Rossmann fold nucleotide-binding protein DprA/Smf involved in DNA uptake